MSAAEDARIPKMPVHKTGISMGAKNEAPSGTKTDTSTKNEKKIKTASHFASRIKIGSSGADKIKSPSFSCICIVSAGMHKTDAAGMLEKKLRKSEEPSPGIKKR